MSTLEAVIGKHEDRLAAGRRRVRSGRVVSRDGTTIAYERIGQGPPILLVDGALCSRSLGPMLKLAQRLAQNFTVFTYDRRGRGESGDTAPYAVEREIEDIEALLHEAGGSAFVCGVSSGAVLALTAAARGLPIRKLALYEAPLIVDGSRPTTEDDWARIDELIAAGSRADAVRAFLKSVGVPAIIIAIMRWLPLWSKVTAVAHTLPHDGAIVREYQRGQPLSAAPWGSVSSPVLVMDGGKSPVWQRNAMRALATVITNARYRTLEGQTHNVGAKALAPVLKDFFGLQ